MSNPYYDVAFTPAVKDAQVQYGTRRPTGRDVAREGSRAPGEPSQALDADARTFVTGRDGFYLASVSSGGWPYVQFRGGPPGFVRVVDPHVLGWADFVGNGQYISAGNITEESKVALFFMDYAQQRRLKIYGHARVEDVRDNPVRAESFAPPDYPALIERAITVHVAAYDWNCPRHITPRFTADEIARASSARVSSRATGEDARPSSD